MPVDVTQLGEMLRKIRLKRKLTLQQVAEQTGVSVATLSRIERSAFENVKSETLATLNEWIARNEFVARKGRQLETPEIVGLHLRADKNLDRRTADALANLFRTVYEELTEKMKKK